MLVTVYANIGLFVFYEYLLKYKMKYHFGRLCILHEEHKVNFPKKKKSTKLLFPIAFALIIITGHIC